MTKICKRCKQEKPIEAFRYDARKNDNHYATCKQCIADRADSRHDKVKPVTKVCSECKKNLPAVEFGIDRAMKDGLRLACKACRKVECQIRYNNMSSEQRQKLKDSTKRWVKENPEKVKAWLRRRDLKRAFNITPEVYDDMLKRQNAVCAICKKPETAKAKQGGQRLAVDHEHKTGKVRGLLCSSCNRALGGFRENTAILLAAVDYLKVHSAS